MVKDCVRITGIALHFIHSWHFVACVEVVDEIRLNSPLRPAVGISIATGDGEHIASVCNICGDDSFVA